ncbi:MAG: thioredoxin [Gammaproteobacteria bacterium]|nr:thioredoxin [Gammaproteobacteria bacterium]MDH4254999.1 thioredoxin [Gammaproteobacteria bacterium]MDH5311576.1 thioredoxin [Gammaproteobacteria bacterium]
MADSPYIIDVTRENFRQVMEASFEVPVLMDFWASWCQPCKVLMPVLAKLAEEFQGGFLLAKLNTEEQQDIAARFGIRSIPTVKLFRDGQPVDEFMGALPEPAVRKFLDRHVARESDAIVQQARERLLAGDADGAIALLEEARAADPANPRVTLALAGAQAAAGEVTAAEASLAGLPADEQAKPEVVALRSRLYFEGQLAGAPVVAELEARFAADPGDHQALFQLALYRVVAADYETAVELLLQLMKKERGFGDGAGRRALLKVFELLGDDPRVSQYRRRMASLLH